MPDWLRFPLVLGLVSAASGAGLGFVYSRTYKDIKASERRKLAAAFENVEGYASFEPKTHGAGKESFPYYRLLAADGACVGLATEVACPGSYNSTEPVRLVVVTGPGAERVLRVEVTRCSETPGFGARLVESPPVNTWAGRFSGREDAEKGRPPFLTGFDGRAPGELALEPDGGKVPVDAMTGATITARAATAGARAGLKRLRAALEGGRAGAVTGATERNRGSE